MFNTICAPKGWQLVSWGGTGRFIFNNDYTDTDFELVAARICAAAAEEVGRRLVVGRCDAHQQSHPASDVERADSSSLAPWCVQSAPREAGYSGLYNKFDVVDTGR